MRTSLMNRILAGGFVLVAAGCAPDGGGSGPGSTAAASGTGASTGTGGANGPILLSARLDDRDASGGASAGDTIALAFDADIDASRLTVAGLRLLSAADGLGAGAGVAQTGPREVTVTLGAGAALTLYESYRLHSPGGSPSPAAISVDPGAVYGADGSASRAGRPAPITLPAAQRAKFQPDQHRGAYSPFRGQMHAHTTYSDGQQGIPGDAFDMARGNGLDFFVVTDHLEFLYVQTWKWPAKRQQAEGRTIDGLFVALWGYEWGSGIANPLGPTVYNHVNVLSDKMVDVLKSVTLDGFYGQVAGLGDDPIMKFNHPDSLGASRQIANTPFTFTYDNWDDFRYEPRTDRFVRFVRTMPGYSGSIEKGYGPFLEHGWHIAPAFGEDNHSPDWGHTEKRMGLFATALTREGIREAMRARRSFTSQDRDVWVRLVADDPAGDLWMGSTVVGPGPVKLKVDCADPTDPVKMIEVVTVGGTVAFSQSAGAANVFSAEFLADPSEDAYYYVRLTEEDGDLVYSAPIFVDR